ncbi:hypothetical protein EJM73_08605 [Clostridium botulinum]|uniref:hypothetical protein n=1 Tax=Clostridium botulinum TaxID=1491 RepID=UPI001375C559|nr:hypothetical protein [Clostridium botulinum]NCI19684.1 hypothetical protein [Clostridium botulinum]NCI35722.1 hypothetical protein [Clostridium botulinum]NCI71579.1 hypothetical protein [Clostridium botulinum]NDI38771.1 hypothetical protein [Clostridium botulinum]
MKVNYDDEFMLSHIDMDLLYIINDNEYVMRNTDNKRFKVNKNKYNKLVEEGEEAFKNTWRE